jgi:hypothetical protein
MLSENRLPGFLNASFTWFKHGLITSVWNPKVGELVVVKVEEAEMVW